MRRQYLNLVDTFSGKKSILTKPAIRPFFLNVVTIRYTQFSSSVKKYKIIQNATSTHLIISV